MNLHDGLNNESIETGFRFVMLKLNFNILLRNHIHRVPPDTQRPTRLKGFVSGMCRNDMQNLSLRLN